MERVSIKSYASKNKISMFNVVKMIKAGELKSEVVEEDGKEVTYILCEDALPKVKSAESKEKEEKGMQNESLEARVARLEQDVAILKRELDAFKMSIGIKG